MTTPGLRSGRSNPLEGFDDNVFYININEAEDGLVP